jgi:hypothetical protein
LNTPRKKIKQTLLSGTDLKDWQADVWTVRPSDSGITLEGSPEDVLVLSLEEHSAGGYLWDVDSLNEQGFSDTR